MGFFDNLFGSGIPKSNKPADKCSFCGSKIDHYGFTANDAHTAMSGNNNQVAAMMRGIGGRCSKCNIISCAHCYSDHNRSCPGCSGRIAGFP
jgi:hypothetical protein